MIPEIPIKSAKIFRVRSHSDKLAAGLQTPMDLTEGSDNSRLVRQVLKKVAGKDNIDGVFLDPLPRFCAVLEKELYTLGQFVPGSGIHIDGKARFRLDSINEFAMPAAKIEYREIGSDEAGEEIGNKNAPHSNAMLRIRLEPPPVD